MIDFFVFFGTPRGINDHNSELSSCTYCRRPEGRDTRVAISRWRELRLHLGMDQAEMARWFDTKQSVISLWETGKRTPPHRDAAIKFGVSVDWLEELSSRRWGQRVIQLGRDYRHHLTGLPAVEQQQLTEATPSARVVHAYETLQTLAPDLVTQGYFSRLIGLTPVAFESIVANRLAVTETAVQRLADYTGIVERWFTAGDFSVLEDPDLDEYYPLVHQMRAEGITPEDIRRVWHAIRTFR